MSYLREVSSQSCLNSNQPRLSECEQLSVDETASNAERFTTLSAAAADTPQNWNYIFCNLPQGNNNGSSASGRE